VPLTLAVLLLSIGAWPAEAGRGGGGGGGGGGRGGGSGGWSHGGSHGGHGHGGSHHGHHHSGKSTVFVGAVWGVGPYWWDPWWYGGPYYSNPYYAPRYYGVYSTPFDAMAVGGPTVYIERRDGGAWYYCPSAGAYYPTAPSCPEAWVKVPPRDP
jgi:hypothetical protein